MGHPISRRDLSRYIANELREGSRTKIINELAAYLIDTRRVNELDLIMRDVDHELLMAGHVNATVTSARELSDAIKQQVEKLLLRQTSASTVNLGTNIDPTVIGGIKLDAPGRGMDKTIAHQLNTLRTANRKV